MQPPSVPYSAVNFPVNQKPSTATSPTKPPAMGGSPYSAATSLPYLGANTAASQPLDRPTAVRPHR